MFSITLRNRYSDVRYGSRLLLSFFMLKIVNFCEYLSSSFSPKSASIDPLRELRRSSRHVYAAGGTYGEGSAPLATSPAAHLLRIYRRPCGSQSARATARPDRRRGILLCSDFSEHTRPPRSVGDGPPGPCQALASSPTAAPSLSAWSVLTLAQCGQLSAHRQKGGDTSSLARCHQDMANTWRVSQARKSNATAIVFSF